MAKTPVNKALQPLSNDQEYYVEAFRYYIKVTNVYGAMQEWTDGEFDSKVGRRLLETFEGQIGDKPLRVLGVGSGEGQLELMQLNRLKTKFPSLSACVVEPSDMIRQYQIKVNSTGYKLDGIDFEWRNQVLDEFMKSDKSRKKFHFISAIHAIYYLGDLTEALKKLYHMLEDGGVLLIIVISEHTGTGQLWKNFPTLGIQTGSPDERITSTHVSDALDKLQFPYQRSDYTERSLFTPCMTDEDSKESSLFLDFITHTIDFKHAPQELREKVLSCIKNTSVEKKGQDYFYKCTCDIFTVTK